MIMMGLVQGKIATYLLKSQEDGTMDKATRSGPLNGFEKARNRVISGVRYIVDSPCGHKLQELNLTNCIRVGDIALVNIHKR